LFSGKLSVDFFDEIFDDPFPLKSQRALVIIGGLVKLHSEVHHNLYASPNVIRIIK